MNLLNLYEYAEINGIKIDNYQMPNKVAFSIKFKGVSSIAMDYTKIEDNRTEKHILAEEIGHIQSDAFYYLNDLHNPCFKTNAARAERKAQEWSYSALVPIYELKKLLIHTHNIFEVAEHFDVDTLFAEKAINYYKIKKLL